MIVHKSQKKIVKSSYQVGLFVMVIGSTLITPLLTSAATTPVAAHPVSQPPTNYPLTGVFVPVDDRQLNQQFYLYHKEFDTYANLMHDWIEQDTDSLKRILAGNPSAGVLTEGCDTRDAPYYEVTYSPEDPNDYTNDYVAEHPVEFVDLPELRENVQVNDSKSISCLLQELVEWRKLDLNLTVHKMMKDFIADAQAFLMSKQMQTFIVGGLIDWSRSGIEQKLTPSDTIYTSAYTADREQQTLNRNTSLRLGLLAQIGNSSAGGSDQGFVPLDIYDPYRSEVNRQVQGNTLNKQTRDLEMLPVYLKNTLDDVFTTAGSEVEDTLAGDFKKKGWAGYANLMFEPANNPIGVSDIAISGLTSQVAQSEQDQYAMMSDGQGFIDSTTPVDTDDEYGRIRRVETPAYMNQRTVSRTVEESGFGALTQADETAERVGDNAQELQTSLVDTMSLRDYDTLDLTMKSPDFNVIYDQFSALITGSYYDTTSDTRFWTHNTLTSITDGLYSNVFNDNDYGPNY